MNPARTQHLLVLTLLDPLRGIEAERVITEQATPVTAPYHPGIALLDELRAAAARCLARDGVDPAASPLPLDGTLGAGPRAVTVEPLRLVCAENSWRLPRDARDLPHSDRPAATFLDGYTTLLPGAVLFTYLSIPTQLADEELAVLLVALDAASPRVGAGRRCQLGQGAGAGCLVDLDALLDPAAVAHARQLWATAHSPRHDPPVTADDTAVGGVDATHDSVAAPIPAGWMP